MSEASQPVAVQILDREYVVGCAPEQRGGLIEAAQRLDADMRRLRNAARTVSVDRIAVLAALNIAHELIQQQRSGQQHELDLSRALNNLREKLDGALSSYLKSP